MKTVSEYLKQLGLSEIETKLYLGLLEKRSTTVMELANHVSIKRITAHFNVESLIAKGLITESRKGARRQIIAEDPDKLQTLLDDRELEIGQLKQNLPTIIQSISKNLPKAKKDNDVEIRYYEGKKAVHGIYQETLKANEMYSFADLEKYYEVFPDASDMWEQAYNDNPKRIVRDILVDNPTSRKFGIEANLERYFVKFLPTAGTYQQFEFSDYIMYDNKVGIIQLSKDNPTATVIESPQIYMSLRLLHKVMWDLLPEIGNVKQL